LSHKDARVHCVVLKVRAAPRSTWRLLPQAAVRPWRGSWPVYRPEVQACARSPQDPTTCQAPAPSRSRSTVLADLYLRDELVSAPNNRCSTLEHLLNDIRAQTRLWIACATSAP
jgi:hypothetical protein